MIFVGLFLMPLPNNVTKIGATQLLEELMPLGLPRKAGSIADEGDKRS